MENVCPEFLVSGYSIVELDKQIRIANLRMACLINMEEVLVIKEKLHKNFDRKKVIRLISNAGVA